MTKTDAFNGPHHGSPQRQKSEAISAIINANATIYEHILQDLNKGKIVSISLRWFCRIGFADDGFHKSDHNNIKRFSDSLFLLFFVVANLQENLVRNVQSHSEFFGNGQTNWPFPALHFRNVPLRNVRPLGKLLLR